MLIIFLCFLVFVIAQDDPASQQLLQFKEDTKHPIGIIRTSAGSPVDANDTITLNANLIDDEYFMDTMTHFDRERIPERVVHTKGAGAFGYFQVTHDITDICKAKLFSEIGKKTSVAVRFSPTLLERGSADTIRNPIGFSVKFYTEDGNFDIVALNTPMFAVKDPVLFSSFIHAQRRNPVTFLRDPNMVWDFITLQPETIYFFMWLFAGYGTPNTYRHMPGFSIHTYQVYNQAGESYFIRFHFIPALGVENLSLKTAMKLTAEDPDYDIRDLYNSIENSSLVQWDLGIQVLTDKDVKNSKFDVFDVTKILPLEQYPLKPLGKLILNKNPTNYFRDIENLAFCPGNVIPGVVGAPDKLFQARRFSYRDTQNYRLGSNFNKMYANIPADKVLTYNRDGVAPLLGNMEDVPNYYINSFNGPIPYKEANRPSLIQIHQTKPDNFDQASRLWTEGFTDEQRDRMIADMSDDLSRAEFFIQKRALKLFTYINEDMGKRLKYAMNLKTQ